MNNKLSIAGLLYGLVVHFKLYPIIYLPAFYLALTKSNKVWKAFKPNAKKFKFVTEFHWKEFNCFYQKLNVLIIPNFFRARLVVHLTVR